MAENVAKFSPKTRSGPDGPSHSGSGATSTTEPITPQQRRLQDLIAAALATACPLEANLGIVKCGLIDLAQRLHTALVSALGEPPATVAEIEQVSRTIDQYLRLTKQIDRYAQLAIKLRQSGQGD